MGHPVYISLTLPGESLWMDWHDRLYWDVFSVSLQAKLCQCCDQFHLPKCRQTCSPNQHKFAFAEVLQVKEVHQLLFSRAQPDWAYEFPHEVKSKQTKKSWFFFFWEFFDFFSKSLIFSSSIKVLKVLYPGGKTSGFLTVWTLKICLTSGPDVMSGRALLFWHWILVTHLAF